MNPRHFHPNDNVPGTAPGFAWGRLCVGTALRGDGFVWGQIRLHLAWGRLCVGTDPAPPTPPLSTSTRRGHEQEHRFLTPRRTDERDRLGPDYPLEDKVFLGRSQTC